LRRASIFPPDSLSYAESELILSISCDGDLRSVKFRHRRLFRYSDARVFIVAVCKVKVWRFDLRRHIREFKINRLKLGDRMTELLLLLVSDGGFKTRPGAMPTTERRWKCAVVDDFFIDWVKLAFVAETVFVRHRSNLQTTEAVFKVSIFLLSTPAKTFHRFAVTKIQTPKFFCCRVHGR